MDAAPKTPLKPQFQPAPIMPISFAMFPSLVEHATQFDGLTVASSEALMDIPDLKGCYCAVCFRMYWLSKVKYLGSNQTQICP
jgi:hypothetical protein